MPDQEIDTRHLGLNLAQRRALLKPGERAYGLLPDGTKVEIVGTVPNDGSTRQQRRAKDYVAPADVPAGE